MADEWIWQNFRKLSLNGNGESNQGQNEPMEERGTRIDEEQELVSCGQFPIGSVPNEQIPIGPVPSEQIPIGPVPSDQILIPPVPSVQVLIGPVPSAQVFMTPVPSGQVLIGQVYSGQVLSEQFPIGQFPPSAQFFFGQSPFGQSSPPGQSSSSGQPPSGKTSVEQLTLGKVIDPNKLKRTSLGSDGIIRKKLVKRYRLEIRPNRRRCSCSICKKVMKKGEEQKKEGACKPAKEECQTEVKECQSEEEDLECRFMPRPKRARKLWQPLKPKRAFKPRQPLKPKRWARKYGRLQRLKNRCEPRETDEEEMNYHNFLMLFSNAHMKPHPKALAKQGEKVWGKLSKEQKQRFSPKLNRLFKKTLKKRRFSPKLARLRKALAKKKGRGVRRRPRRAAKPRLPYQSVLRAKRKIGKWCKCKRYRVVRKPAPKPCKKQKPCKKPRKKPLIKRAHRRLVNKKRKRGKRAKCRHAAGRRNAKKRKPNRKPVKCLWTKRRLCKHARLKRKPRRKATLHPKPWRRANHMVILCSKLHLSKNSLAAGGSKKASAPKEPFAQSRKSKSNCCYAGAKLARQSSSPSSKKLQGTGPEQTLDEAVKSGPRENSSGKVGSVEKLDAKHSDNPEPKPKLRRVLTGRVEKAKVRQAKLSRKDK